MRSKRRVPARVAGRGGPQNGASWARISAGGSAALGEEAARVMAEPRVEEACVVRAHLAPGRVGPGHLGRVLRRHAHPFGGEEQVEVLGLEHNTVAGLGHHVVPEFGRVVHADRREVDEAAVALRPVADRLLAPLQQVEREPETALPAITPPNGRRLRFRPIVLIMPTGSLPR